MKLNGNCKLLKKITLDDIINKNYILFKILVIVVLSVH